MRRIIAVAMTVMYLVIALGPSASLALHCETAAHLLTGACSGDCNICGCSPESRAAQTCCCSRKEQQLVRLQARGQASQPECCPKGPIEKEAVIASCGCPCGSDDSFVLSGLGKGEIIPHYFTGQFAMPLPDTLYPETSHLLTSRHPEPPDPPPRQS